MDVTIIDEDLVKYARCFASLGDLEEIFDSGRSVNSHDLNHYSLLMVAVEQNNLPLIETLITRKVNVNAETKLGHTALDIAHAKKATIEVVRALEKAGARQNKVYKGLQAVQICTLVSGC